MHSFHLLNTMCNSVCSDFKKSLLYFVDTMEGKKFVPNKKGDIGMEVYYLCQLNTYVIAREFGEQQ